MKVWNVAGVNINKRKSENAQFLTNNALERYNRHFNSIVPSSYPNLVVFAHVLKNEAKSVSQHLEDVRKGRDEAPTYSTTFIETPKEFLLFKWPHVASKNTRQKYDGEEVLDLGMAVILCGCRHFRGLIYMK
jgi:hypothetical protein